jgi:hypothetical protein
VRTVIVLYAVCCGCPKDDPPPPVDVPTATATPAAAPASSADLPSPIENKLLASKARVKDLPSECAQLARSYQVATLGELATRARAAGTQRTAECKRGPGGLECSASYADEDGDSESAVIFKFALDAKGEIAVATVRCFLGG